MKNLIKNINIVHGGKIDSHRREKHLHTVFTGIVFEKGEFHEVLDLRVYDTGNTATACLWIRGRADKDNHQYGHGSGSAGGYGYWRAGAAIYEAFSTAGIEVDYNIQSGESSVERAMMELMKKLYPRRKHMHIVESHG